MTMLNGLFYLMLLIAGIAVAMVLIKLKRAEDRAEKELARLEAKGMSANRSIMVRNDRYRSPSVSSLNNDYQSYREIRFRKMSSFMMISTTSEPMPASVSPTQVSYDFSTASLSNRKEQATVCLLPDSNRSDCCA